MSEVERYLDGLFDRLAGTGGAGRRALAEAEDHLRAAAADAMAAGLAADAAEQQAVARFGPPGRIARQLRRAAAGRPADTALSSAWLLAGTAVAGLGLVYLAAAARTVTAQWGHPSCRTYLAPACGFDFALTRQVAASGAVIVAAAITLLAARWLLIRRAGPAAGGRRTAATATLCCAATAAFSYAASAPPGTPGQFGVWQLAGLNTPLITGGVAAAAALAATTWTLARSRGRRVRHEHPPPHL